jgi:hypothetical protein
LHAGMLSGARQFWGESRILETPYLRRKCADGQGGYDAGMEKHKSLLHRLFELAVVVTVLVYLWWLYSTPGVKSEPRPPRMLESDFNAPLEQGAGQSVNRWKKAQP